MGVVSLCPIAENWRRAIARFSDSKAELIGVEFLSLPPLNCYRGEAQSFIKTV
ncbi:MAG: hypothetical protein AAFQ80_18625 [Cyanobacteria bacterium J06621_8]